jgi:hypothetical protein
MDPSQCVKKRLELWLVLLDDAIRQVLPARHQDLAREFRQATVVIAQIKPAVMPPTIRRDELGQYVEIASTRPHLEGVAFGVHRLSYSPLARLLGKVALKRWSYNFQWGSTPKYPSQTAAKMVAYETELGAR